MINRRTFISSTTGAAALLLAAPLATVPAKAETVDMLRLMAPGALPDVVLGNKDAKVTIIEYASMTCPHCQRFHTSTYPQLKAKYIDTGKVKFIFREFPLDALAAGASVMARCSGDDKFYAVTDLLFDQQTVWAMDADPVSALQKIALQTGMSADDFTKCLSSDANLKAVLAVRQKASDQFGVNSTPTFFINGEKAGGELSIDEISKLIDPKL